MLSAQELDRGLNLLKRLAKRVEERRKNPPSLEEVANRFHDGVRDSGAFAYLGVMTGEDPHGRPAFEVYILTKPALTQEQQEQLPEVVHLFDDLSFALKPKIAPHLGLVMGDECSLQQLEEALKEQEAAGKSIVLQEHFE